MPGIDGKIARLAKKVHGSMASGTIDPLAVLTKV
jgi:hypothetical protein